MVLAIILCNTFHSNQNRFLTSMKINLKVKSNHRSEFFNLSNWKGEAWKKSGLHYGIRTRDLRDTGAMLYQLSYKVYEATHWERGQFIEFISSRAVKWCEVYIKLKNSLRWSLFTFIYDGSSNMNYFIYTSHHFTVWEDMNSINLPLSQCVAS